MDYGKLAYSARKYWKLAYADEIECAVSRDGLMFVFAIADVEELLKQYPRGDGVWYFNETRDRAIAELWQEGLVTVNPQFVWKNFREVLTD